MGSVCQVIRDKYHACRRFHGLQTYPIHGILTEVIEKGHSGDGYLYGAFDLIIHHKKNTMKTSGKILTAAAVGLAAGAVAGLLMAPRSGKETREMLKKKGEQAAEKVTEGFEKGRQQATDLKVKAEEKMRDVNRKVAEVI
jgi:gas vesicle protein